MINEIRDRSLQLHGEHTILNRICEITPNENQTEDFHTLQRDSTLDRIQLENGQIVRPDNMVHGIVNDEIDFIIDQIQNNSQVIRSRDNLFQTIRITASELRDQYLPTKIVIPRSIFSQILDWNRSIDSNSNETNTLDVGLKGNPLEVILLPLNYHFSDIVILSQHSVSCEFIPNQGNLLHVGLELDRGNQIPFWLRVILRLMDINNDAIRIINFEN